MSTITKERIELFIKNPLENGLTRSEQMEVARIALASLEADPIGEVSEKRYGLIMDGTVDLGGKSTYRIIKGEKAMKLFPLGTKFYTSPPAPVAVPECFKRLLHHAYGMTMGHDWNKGTMAGHHRAKLCQAVDECRAAMLHGADGTLTNEGTMQLSGNSEQIEPVSNRDELPDGWVACSERMPDRGKKVLIRISCSDHFNIESGEYKGDGLWLGCWFDTYGKKGSAYQVAHWMPLPAAPQWKVK